jgi:RNA polymerase sigma factor (TIGR02999 family)
MSDITRILSQMEAGDEAAAELLLPLVYEELRRLARAKLRHEKPGMTIQATALVHEAYLRLLGPDGQSEWQSRGHFFSAAAEAMRRILVEGARRRKRVKHGAELARQPLEEDCIAAEGIDDDLVELDAALERLAAEHPRKAELIKLCYFAGTTQQQAAEALGISIATAERDWSYARAWLFRQIRQGPASPGAE